MLHDAYDVAIVGAGPSGIGVATLLAEYSLKVLLIDENNQIGGQIWRSPVCQSKGSIKNGLPTGMRTALQKNQNLDIITHTSVLGVFPEKILLLATHSDGVKEIAANRIIFATGAREKVRPFKGWTLPSVMTLGAVQHLLKYYGVLASHHILIAGTGPLIYLLGSQITAAGGRVTSILERSPAVAMLNLAWMLVDHFSKVGQGFLSLSRLIMNSVPIEHRMQVVEVKEKEGRLKVIAARFNHDGATIPDSTKCFETGLLACGNGFVPNVELPLQAGCELTYAENMGGWIVKVDTSMETSVSGIFAVGEITGIAGGEQALIEGRLAALSILSQFGILRPKEYRQRQAALLRKSRRYIRLGRYLNGQWRIRPGEWQTIEDTTVICRCEDVTMGSIRSWIREGLTTASDLKRATRCGMGNCQGRTCAPLIFDILASSSLKESLVPKPFSVRTPVKPIPLGSLIH